MPDDDESDKSSTDRKATENVLTQKFGPLPLFVWVALAAGAIGAIVILKKKGASSSGTVTSVPVATGVAGGQAPSGGSSSGTSSTPVDTSGFVSSAQETQDVTGLSQQISTLSSTIADQLKGITANETTLGTGISNANANISSLQSGFNSLQSYTSGLGSTVNGLSGQVSSLGNQANDIASLQQQQNETNANISYLVNQQIPNIYNQIHGTASATSN